MIYSRLELFLEAENQWRQAANVRYVAIIGDTQYKDIHETKQALRNFLTRLETGDNRCRGLMGTFWRISPGYRENER